MCLPVGSTLKPCLELAEVVVEAHQVIEKLMGYLFNTLHQKAAQSLRQWPGQPHLGDHCINERTLVN